VSALALALLLAAADGGGPALQYEVRASPDSAFLEVAVRRGPQAPASFEFARRGPVDVVLVERGPGQDFAKVTVDDEGGFLVPQDWSVVRYRYALDDAERFGNALFFGTATADGMAVAGRAYLVRPRPCTRALDFTFTTSGRPALTPWGDGARLPVTALEEPGFHVFGGRRCTRSAGAVTLAVGLLGKGAPGLTDEVVCDWLAASAKEAQLLKPGFPAKRLVVAAVGVDAEEPALFGTERDSSPPSLAVLWGTRASVPSFRKDWVAVHELLHAVHPQFDPEVPWLAEGLSTFFTEVVRARSGRFAVTEAWGELLDGFERGAAQAGKRKGQAFMEGRIHGDYQATYWLGALFALSLDLRLRELTGGKASLETAFAAVSVPCTVEQLARAVDAAAGKPVWKALLERFRGEVALSQRQAVLSQLGVRREKGAVTFVEAPLAAARDALTAPITRTGE